MFTRRRGRKSEFGKGKLNDHSIIATCDQVDITLVRCSWVALGIGKEADSSQMSASRYTRLVSDITSTRPPGRSQ